MKVTVDGVDGDGKPAHSEWTGQFDGKATTSVTGDPTPADARLQEAADAHTLELTGKKAGSRRPSPAAWSSPPTARAARSPRAAPTRKGKKVSATAVYDKQ
mgnify:CR=1 FL=1